jgi:aspartate 1-decarboxylase
MLRHALHAKLHHAVVTYCDADYVGSITIDRDLLDASGIRANEKVLVADCDSAARFETYVIPGERGSGVIGVNGACARPDGGRKTQKQVTNTSEWRTDSPISTNTY